MPTRSWTGADPGAPLTEMPNSADLRGEAMKSTTADQPRRRHPRDYVGVYDGTPRWDIGRPQPALLAAARNGGLDGRVLDVGCGTGEHALLAAAMGFRATGVDTSATAIDIARRKAATRRLDVDFLVWNALDLPALGNRFGTVIDSGLFHVLDDIARTAYADALAQVVDVGGRCHLLCFADREPGDDGPRRVSADEIRVTFAAHWRVDTIDAVRIETTNPLEHVEAWRARLTRR
jgi:SAM-dependent methyltransferase